MVHCCSLNDKKIYCDLIALNNQNMLSDVSDDDSVVDEDHIHFMKTTSFNTHHHHATDKMGFKNL